MLNGKAAIVAGSISDTEVSIVEMRAVGPETAGATVAVGDVCAGSAQTPLADKQILDIASPTKISPIEAAMGPPDHSQAL